MSQTTSTFESHIGPKERSKKESVFLISITLFLIVIVIGTVGYRILFNLSWLDSFYNASLILAALNVTNEPQTPIQKIFVIIYSLVAVFLLISIASRGVSDIIDLFERN